MVNRVFKVIEGGPTGGQTTAAYISASPASETEGGGGAGGNGGSQAVIIGKLEQSVDWLWKAVGTTFTLGLLAIIGSYLLLASRIDGRYDRIADKLDGVSGQIGELKLDVAKASKENDQSSATQNRGRTRPVDH